MTPSRIAVYIVGGFIVVTAILMGPLVPGVELPAEEESTSIGTGNATVTVSFIPETVTIEGGSHGANVYYLEVPAATVEVSDLRGNPVLDYSLSIDELGYSRGSIYVLEELGEGVQRITLEQDSLEPEDIEQGEYDGEITLTLRGETEQVLVQQNITVEVEE